MINRTFPVRVGNNLSLLFYQVEGVSQVSVLSVLYFALAINDIVYVVPDGVSCYPYLDDFVLYLSGSIFPSVVRWMQLEIDRIVDCVDCHGFRFSVENPHAILFRRTRRVFPETSFTL